MAVTRSARLGLLLLCLLAWPTAAQQFDPAHTRFGFEVRTRWGPRIAGTFPDYDGEVSALPDGRHQVRIRLATRSVEVAGSPRYAALARGRYFFDAENYPLIEFVSEPYADTLLRDGGPLRGTLSLHGTRHVETFGLEAATCARPGRDCDVVARGSVRREDYGLDSWQLALHARVSFTMRVRLRDQSL
ncbi:YceI family protein [Lysobacter koreensis]|uniref:YceI family protein n=1 Tax=Lysobacter koreensis TaxID=266122 RepID=A0ABW2YN30_9GAMM